MRLFTGIALPPEASAPVLALIDQLQPLAHIAWTKAEKLHITTRFIGDWPESRLDELKQALTAISAPLPIEVRIHGLNWLPNPHRPLTVHAAVEATEPLKQLAADTDSVLLQLGLIPEPRTYRPHVTLGRIRRQDHDPIGPLQRAVEQTRVSVAPFRAESFHLYLSANGTYTKLSDYPL
jgi:2'-5' RNA ligase